MTAVAAAHLPDRQDWTVDEVASLPEDLHYELINGRLLLSPAAMPIHQFISYRTISALEVHAPEEVLITFDQSVMIDSRNEPRPDVVITREEGANRTPVLAADVLLVVEVVSPSSTARDRQEKARLYAYAGVPAYWIIDPLAERITFTQFLLGRDGAYRRKAQTDGSIKIDHPWEVTLDLPAWTRRRDRIRAASVEDVAGDN